MVENNLLEDKVPVSDSEHNSENSGEENMGEQLGGGRGFSVQTFSGGEKEDIDVFLYTIDLSFYAVENTIPDDRRPRAKIAYLASYLREAAFTWWVCLENEKKDTWEHAVEVLQAKYQGTGIRRRIAINQERLEKQKA